MALASHMGEYFGKTLVLEQWGYENCQKSGISCWNRLYEGNSTRLGENQRSKPLCMGEWVCCGWCLVRLNVAFRELSNTWKLLGLDGPCQPHG